MLRCLTAAFGLCALLSAQDPALDTLRRDGHWKQLRVRVEGWLAAKPQDPYALLWMSQVKQAFGDIDGALELARKAAAMQPGDPDMQAQLANAAGQSAGRATGKLKQFSLAREMKKAGEAALAVRPDHPVAAGLMVQFYLQAPGIIGGGEGKAKDLAARAAKADPIRGLLLQADIAVHRKDVPSARAFIQQALARDAHSYEALMAMASAHLRVQPQALDQALETYRLALSVRPESASAHAQVAAILAEQGKWSELDAALAEARNRLPDNLVPYYGAGVNLIQMNQHLDRAEGLLRTYLTQAPEGGAPDHAAAHWWIGQLKEKLGKAAEAIAAYELALKLRPGYKRAAGDLARLKKG